MNLVEIKQSMRQMIAASFEMFSDYVEINDEYLPFVLKDNILFKLREAEFYYKEDFVYKQFEIADRNNDNRLDFEEFTTFYFMLNSLSSCNRAYISYDYMEDDEKKCLEDFVEIGVLPCGYLYCKDKCSIFFSY